MSKAGVLYTYLVRKDDSPTVQPVKLRKSHRCRRKYANAKVQGGISHNPTSKVRTTVQLRKQATNN